MKTSRRFLIGALLLSLGLAACNPPQNTPTAEPTAAPNPTAPPVSTPTGPIPTIPADAVTYEFVEGNFSLAIPAGWRVAGPFEAAQYRLYTFGDAPEQSGGPGVSQIIIANEGAVSIEQFAELQCSVCPVNAIEEATLGGLPAQRTVIGGGSAPAFEWYFATHAGKLIGVSVRPVGGGMEWVTQSVQFTAPAAVGQTQPYRNPAVGLEMQIPAGWQISENTPAPAPVFLDTLAYIYSQPLPTPEPKGGEGPVDGVKIDVTAIYDESINQSLENALAWLKAGLSESNGTIISERRVVLASGLQAVRVQTSSSFGEGVTLLAKVNNVTVLLGGSGKDLSLFDAAANTLHAVAPNAGALLNGPCNVAYANLNELYCLNANNQPVLVAQSEAGTTLTQPKISSDGGWVAFLVNQADGNSQLWAVSVRGERGLEPLVLLAGQEQLPSADGQSTNSPNRFEWQAGTTRLFFDTRFIPVGGIQGPGDYENHDLWAVDVNNALVSNVLPTGAGGLFFFAPDGQKLAFSTPTSVKLLALSTSVVQTVLEFPSISTYSEYQYRPAVTWSPDSTFFTTLVPSADPLAADSSGALYRVSADGTAQTVWVRLGNFVFGGTVLPAPDGQWLVSSTIVDNVPIWRVSQSDDSNETVFASTPLSVNGFGWAPDSQHYAYGVVPDGQNFVLQTNGAQEEFGTGTTPVALEWASPNQFYFLAVRGNAQYALYSHILGQGTQLLADGLSAGVLLDVRN